MASSRPVYEAWLAALRDGDRRRAFRVLDDSGLELPALYVEVLQPALREIGRLWQENEISVADEHLATAITQAAMARTFERTFAWGPGPRPSLVAACADGERHEVGLRMLCDLLELKGWDTTFLGPTVPLEDLVSMVEARRPDAVALSAAVAPNVPRLARTIEALRERLADPPLILVGGRPFLEDAGLAERIGADLTADDAVKAVEALDRAVS